MTAAHRDAVRAPRHHRKLLLLASAGSALEQVCVHHAPAARSTLGALTVGAPARAQAQALPAQYASILYCRPTEWTPGGEGFEGAACAAWPHTDTRPPRGRRSHTHAGLPFTTRAPQRTIYISQTGGRGFVAASSHASARATSALISASLAAPPPRAAWRSRPAVTCVGTRGQRMKRVAAKARAAAAQGRRAGLQGASRGVAGGVARGCRGRHARLQGASRGVAGCSVRLQAAVAGGSPA